MNKYFLKKSHFLLKFFYIFFILHKIVYLLINKINKIIIFSNKILTKFKK